jgi:hypothetical protein
MANPRAGKCLRIVCAAITYGASLTAAIPKEKNSKPDCFLLPSGQRLTPLAAPDVQLEYLELRHSPQLIAHSAMTIAVSPDRESLLVLTSGYNHPINWLGQSIDGHFAQYVFVYDISISKPVKKANYQDPWFFCRYCVQPRWTKFLRRGRQKRQYLASKYLHGDTEPNNRSLRSSSPRMDLQRHPFTVSVQHAIAISTR